MNFFFRRMIPLAAMQPTRRLGQPYEMRRVNLGDLAPGADPGLDLICRGILEGEAFVFPDEVYAGAWRRYGSVIQRFVEVLAK